MSTQVELLFRNLKENDVVPAMLSPESGFRETPHQSDFRKPLGWGAAETLSLVGVIISAGQLAISLYQLLRGSPGAAVELRLAQGKTLMVVADEVNSPEELARRISESIGDDRN